MEDSRPLPAGWWHGVIDSGLPDGPYSNKELAFVFMSLAAKFAGHPEAWYASQGELSLWLWTRRNTQFRTLLNTPTQVQVEIKRPWLHPYLASQSPIALKLPDGVTAVEWLAEKLPVANGCVDLKWPAPNSGPSPQ